MRALAGLGGVGTDEGISIQPHDLAALDKLYQEHVGRVYRWIRSQVHDDAVAEDLTAQVFFRACTSAATYRGEGTYQAWLFRIARNCVVDHRAASLRVVAVSEPPEGEDPAPSPSAQAIAREDRALVRELIATLPEAERRAIALRYLHEMSVEEVAKILRRTRGAVRVLLHRARARMRRAIEKRTDGESR